MTTSVRVAAFVLGLVAVFAAALGVGAAVGPVGDPAPPRDPGHTSVPAEPSAPVHVGNPHG